MTELPKFVDDDVNAIAAEMVAWYEGKTGKTIYPAQVEQVLIDLMAYRESLTRSAINDAARQNLVAFARAPMLDYLAELVGVYRLEAQYAKAMVRLTFVAPVDSAFTLESGTQFGSVLNLTFASDADAIVPIGVTHIDINVTAVEPGVLANGMLPGRINAMFDGAPVAVASIANLTVTEGGADDEDNEQLRERIRLAPEAFSVAGSTLAYQFHTRSAHPNIIAVAVLSPAPVTVAVYPLTKFGLPGPTILGAVTATLTADKIRPLTDNVMVLPPVEYPYTVRAELTLYDWADATTTLAGAQAALQALVSRNQLRLAHDVEPSQLSAALAVAGVKKVNLLSPAEIIVPDQGWANCTEIIVTIKGIDND